MSNVQAFINKVRPKVGDKESKKFTDTRIIELINEGLEDLGKKAYTTKKSLALPVLPYTKTLEIPEIISSKNLFLFFLLQTIIS